MSLLEDVMINAKAAVSAVGQTAGKLVDISKLRYSAGELNSEISKRFEALGREVYESAKNLDNPPEFIRENVEAIERLYERLETVNEQIAILKNRVKCKNCGFENGQEAVYCNRCGVKLAEAPVEEEQPCGSPACEETKETEKNSPNRQTISKEEEPSSHEATADEENKPEENQ